MFVIHLLSLELIEERGDSMDINISLININFDFTFTVTWSVATISTIFFAIKNKQKK